MTGPVLAGGFGAGGAIERAAGGGADGFGPVVAAGDGSFGAAGAGGATDRAAGAGGAGFGGAGAAGFGATGAAGFAAGRGAGKSSMSRIDLAPVRAGGGGDIGIGIPSS